MAPAHPGAPRNPSPSAPPGWRTWLLSGLWLLVLCWLAFFNGLGSLGLMDKTEALFVEVGHQMIERGDWVTPWWNGERFFDYPVWGYWMVALSFRLFGVSEWAARFPVALAASLVVVALFGLMLAWSPAAESARPRVLRAAGAAGVLATTPGWIGWGRTSTTDMFLASAIALALFGFLLAHRLPRHQLLARLGRVCMALFAAIAVLAKGPLGVLLPGMVVVAFVVLTGTWRQWLRGRSLLAMVLLFLGVCSPWYLAAAQANGMEFVGGFLGFSNLQRFTSVLYNHPGPPWFYLPWVVVLVLPWSLYLPSAIVSLRFWSPDRWRPGAVSRSPETGEGLGLFLLLWLVLMLAFFSVAATKLAGYILPALPAASLLVALRWWPLPEDPSPAGTKTSQAGLRVSAAIEVVLLAAMAVAAVLAPRWVAGDPAYPSFAATLSRSGLPMVLGALLALTALSLLVLVLRRGGSRWLWAPSLGGFLAVLALVIAPLGPLIDQIRQQPLRQLAREARTQALPSEPLWIVGTKRYSILFYGKETAAFVSDRVHILQEWIQGPARLGIGPNSGSIRLIGDRRDLEGLALPDDGVQRLSRHGEQELWRIQIHAFLPR